MGLFSWLDEVLNPKRAELVHPFFGRLEFITGKNIHNETYGFWSGKLITPFAPESISITIDAGQEGPNENHVTRYEALIQKFPELQTSISQVLFQNWSETKALMRESGDEIDEGNKFDKPDAMAEVFDFASISICGDGGYELGYTFRDEAIWPDLELYLGVDQKWEVTFSGGAD